MHAHCPGTTHVHIEPINNGSLLMAAKHALRHIGQYDKPSQSSWDFLDLVAVANPGKFSIRSKHNLDYANKPRYWPDSMPFMRADIEVLKPSVIIVPKSIVGVLKFVLSEVNSLRLPTVVPLYQITALNIRRNIKPQLVNIGAAKPIPFSNEHWPLSRGAERWGMEYYLQWIDQIASTWVMHPD
jgi:hypothetical protein